MNIEKNRNIDKADVMAQFLVDLVRHPEGARPFFEQHPTTSKLLAEEFSRALYQAYTHNRHDRLVSFLKRIKGAYCLNGGTVKVWHTSAGWFIPATQQETVA